MENEHEPGPLKVALHEVIFSCKLTKINHPTLIFNNNPVLQVALQKHLGMFLDCKLIFEEHLKTTVNKNKTIGLLHKFQNFLQRKLLQYINPLSDHTMTMVTLFKTKIMILLSIKDWNHFHTIRH